MLEKKKILTLPKELITDQVYGAQNRLFSYLRKKGIINFDSIQGGNVYGSMEGLMLEMKGDKQPETVDYVLYEIWKIEK